MYILVDFKCIYYEEQWYSSQRCIVFVAIGTRQAGCLETKHEIPNKYRSISVLLTFPKYSSKCPTFY